MDIDHYMKKHVTNSKVHVISAWSVDALYNDLGTMESLDMNKGNFLTAEIIIAPVNLNNVHWILYVLKTYKRKKRIAYYLDPLRGKCLEELAHKKCQRLSKCIKVERRFRKEVEYICDKKFKYLPQYQLNDYDCGPLVCGYAAKVAESKPIDKINIPQIRMEVGLNCGTRHGGGSHTDGIPEPHTYLKEHLDMLYFSDEHINKYASDRINNAMFLTVETMLAQAIATDNNEYLVDQIRLRDFKNKCKIFVPVEFQKMKWLLFVADIEASALYCLDPTEQSISNDEIHAMGENIAKNLREFKRNSEIAYKKEFRNHFEKTISKFCGDSGPLICSYMSRIVLGQKLLNINWKKVTELTKRSLMKQKKENKSQGVTEENKIALKDRIALAKKVHEDLAKQSSVHDCEKLITNHIHQLTSSMEKKTGIDCVLHRKVDSQKDRSLIKRYFSEPKKVFELITNEVLTDTAPSKTKLEEYFRSKSVAAPETDWKFCPEIKCGEKFQFAKIQAKTILSILKNTKETSPGLNNITYRYIRYCDPEGILCEELFNRILETSETPLTWKKFSTLMIPKPGKEGHYDCVSSWRPIAVLDCMYKLFTSCLTIQLVNWITRDKLLHPMQKSCGKIEGCSEHNTVIRCLIEDQRSGHNQNLKIAFLDVADAFGTIPIEHITGILSKMGMEDCAIKIIFSLYEECASMYRCQSISTRVRFLRSP